MGTLSFVSSIHRYVLREAWAEMNSQEEGLLTMAEIERIKCGNGNASIVSEGGCAILVDTCHEEYRDIILKKCMPKNVKLIVLTHGHFDHVQNTAYLSSRLNAPIAMHKDDYALIKDKLAEPILAHTLLGKIIAKLSEKGFERANIEPFEPEVYLGDGDSLEQYGVPAVIIGLPGHTKGSIGIIVGDTDIIVGDALMNMVYPTKSPLYGDRTIMEQSAARISSLGDVTIYFGHGGPAKNRNW
jgi:glyoxylase-like metal-dependent hydrolase (beta-lactamase superfamily II)